MTERRSPETPISEPSARRLPRTASLRMRLLTVSDRAIRRAPIVRRLGRKMGASWVRNALMGGRLGAALDDERQLVSFTVGDIALTAPAHFVRLYVGHAYEPLLVQWLRGKLASGMTAVDVGAHIGYLSMVMARCVGEKGRVIAVEPSPDNLPVLQHNLAANHVSNVVVAPVAASSESGRRDFHVTGSTDSHGFYSHPLTPTSAVIQVDARRLDDLLEDPVQLVKVDVEGGELDVLQGMSRLMTDRSLRWLVLEWNPACQRKAGRRVDELPEVVRGLGFRATAFDDVRGVVRSVDEVLELIRRDKLDDSWYCNLACERQ
jgi:FkbM family methyltransferase